MPPQIAVSDNFPVMATCDTVITPPPSCKIKSDLSRLGAPSLENSKLNRSFYCDWLDLTHRTFAQETAVLFARFSVTNGKLYASQASIPPSSGRTLVIPLARSSSATRALVASLGHEQ
jgi:hypothetical protein